MFGTYIHLGCDHKFTTLRIQDMTSLKRSHPIDRLLDSERKKSRASPHYRRSDLAVNEEETQFSQHGDRKMRSVQLPKSEVPCAHREMTKCLLLSKKCCVCLDKWHLSGKHLQYKDGVGDTYCRDRWKDYCSECRGMLYMVRGTMIRLG